MEQKKSKSPEREVEILSEMLSILRKYVRAVLDMGTISMSPKDEQRLKELEEELAKIRG